MHNIANTVLWIYIVLLVVGGLIGFLKGKSQVSLMMSVVFAALLALCALGIVFQHYVADILLAALLVVFAWRLTKTKKFMPAGLMLILTLAALVLRYFASHSS
ncbi:MAG TPA: TMEM14 family protein [Verrucomicrobiae bacterium]|nr:TMEM14 family protein [Verrucomicrobiae bacterium]